MWLKLAQMASIQAFRELIEVFFFHSSLRIHSPVVKAGINPARDLSKGYVQKLSRISGMSQQPYCLGSRTHFLVFI